MSHPNAPRAPRTTILAALAGTVAMRISLARVLAFALLAACAAPVAAQDAPARAQWTLLFYLAADNDLEGAQMRDLAEMLAVGGSADVHVVVLADRHPGGAGKYTNDALGAVPNWTSAKLLRVERGALRELADWGEVNMGDPATLDRLLQYAAREYPAARYGIVFGNHGLGWPGTAVDESSSNDSLTTLELASALQPFAAAHGAFELIGFDSCLMGNLEVAKAIAPFGRVMVASQEIEPDDGWNYTAVLGGLTAAPSMPGAALGRLIADSFRDQYTGANAARHGEVAKGITLSVVALDRVAPLEQAVAGLATAVDASVARGGRDAWLKVARARAGTESYGRSAATPNPEVYDLADAATNLRAQTGDPAVAAAADAVLAATRGAVVYAVRGEARPKASGLSVFFPPDEKMLDARGETAYDETTFAQANRWYPWLRRYATTGRQDTVKPELAAVSTSAETQAPDAAVEIASELRADDLDVARFVLAVGSAERPTIVGSLPAEPAEDGALAESWDGAWFAIGNDARRVIVPITDFEELDDANDVYWALVPVQVRIAGTREWLAVTAYFELDFAGDEVAGEFVYAVDESGHAARELDLDAGDEVRPVYYTIADDGTEAYAPSTDASQVIRLGPDADLTIDRPRVAPGRWLVGFVARDLAGNVSEQYTEIEVE